MNYVCQHCKSETPPRKWGFFGTVCPECNKQYIPNKELEPYYSKLVGMVGVKAS